MTWKKKALLTVAGIAALAGVTSAASADDWSFFGFWGPQASYVSHDDSDRAYGSGPYDHGYRSWDGGYDGSTGYSMRYTYRDGDGYRGRDGYYGYDQSNRSDWNDGGRQYNRSQGEQQFGSDHRYDPDDDE
jgi:hypothetical protein